MEARGHEVYKLEVWRPSQMNGDQVRGMETKPND